MSYDNTNRGSLFVIRPNDEAYRLIAQGKINVDGNDHYAVALRHPLGRDGQAQLVLYTRAAVLWQNDPDKMKENSPKYSGDLEAIGHNMRMAAWPSVSQNGTNYLSLKAGEKRGGGTQDNGGGNYGGGGGGGGSYPDDEIPF